MNKTLKAMVDELLVESNPDEDSTAKSIRLQQMIVDSEERFSEDDIFDACDRLGMDGDEAVAFVEELASWY